MAPFWPQHPWFPDLLELLVAVPFFLPRRRDLLKQPHFHHYHQNLPVLQLTAWRISQRSARHSGLSTAVASQLTLCRRRSTRVNYQAKWAVYRSWCHRNGHSVSQPSVSKVADFLLYLHRSLSLSYSSIASYRSMLSGVFHFILLELSSHFVVHDLLRSSVSNALSLHRGYFLGTFFWCSAF